MATTGRRFTAALALPLLAAMTMSGPAAAADIIPDDALVVAADGSGTFTSIAEAIEAAAAGDTVVVRPGSYPEALVIDKAITLTADRADGDVVIADADLAGPLLTISDADARVDGFTLSGPQAYVHVIGGAPTLEDLVLTDLGNTFVTEESCHALFGPTGCHAVSIDLQSTDAIVSGSTVRDSGQIRVHAGGSPLIEGNALSGGSHIFLEEFDEGTTVRGNTIDGADHSAIAIYASGRPLIEQNVITGSGTSGIEVGLQLEPGIEPTIRGNSISGNPTGIEVASGAMPTIEGNRFEGNASAIVIAGSDALVSDNRFVDNSSSVFIMRGAPVLDGNDVSGGKVGIGLGSDSAEPILTGNRVCDAETSINLIFGAEMPDLEGNEIC